MRTYAEYLSSLTVKTLNTIAREMVKRDAMLKGYSKLRKAELIKALMESMQIDHMEAIKDNSVKILDVTNEADMDAIAAIMATVAGPVESVSEAPAEQTPNTPTKDDETPSLEDLKYAYRSMRATYRKARGITQVKIGNRLRSLKAQLQIMGVVTATL